MRKAKQECRAAKRGHLKITVVMLATSAKQVRFQEAEVYEFEPLWATHVGMKDEVDEAAYDMEL